MTDAQSALVEQAKTSLRGAEVMLNAGFPGFAAARAYYAMFYLAKALLLEEGLTHSKHSAVIAAFGQRIVKTGRVPPEYQQYLVGAQDSRLTADYDRQDEVPVAEAVTHITQAKQFLDMVEKMLGSISKPNPQ